MSERLSCHLISSLRGFAMPSVVRIKARWLHQKRKLLKVQEFQGFQGLNDARVTQRIGKTTDKRGKVLHA